MNDYATFLAAKSQNDNNYGFDPLWMPDFLFDFQQALVEWALRKGRAAIFADCGLGKTPMQLVWAENVIRHSNRPVLVVTPLAVGAQTIREGAKFGIECDRSADGRLPKARIAVTNYERLHHFTASDFAGVVCDESSILKNFDGERRKIITEFLRTVPYRLLCTATASPNDYIELGTSSEALGELGYMDMLGRFFKNDQNTIKPTVYRHKRLNCSALSEDAKWRFKGHAEIPFWRWVASWARSMRRPSDLGFDDGAFVLPKLREEQYVVKASRPRVGLLFELPAIGLQEQREERRMTIKERCAHAAAEIAKHDRSIAWCHLNPEGDLLEKMIPDSVQVSGADSDEAKEEKLLAFVNGEAKVLVTKPVVAGFGLNLQHCAHMTTFPSHSFEQYYQSVRRCWRFGQERPVTVDIITTEGEKTVLANLKRKAAAADKMFAELVKYMAEVLRIDRGQEFNVAEQVPAWL